MKSASPVYDELRGLGVSKPYASQVASGRRKPSLNLALRLYKKCGTKIGPLKNKTNAEIRTLELAHGLLNDDSHDAPLPEQEALQ